MERDAKDERRTLKLGGGNYLSELGLMDVQWNAAGVNIRLQSQI